MDPPPQAEHTITGETLGNARTPLHDDHDERYGVPTLDELGFDTEQLRPPVWIGGETEALGTYASIHYYAPGLKRLSISFSSTGTTFRT